MKTLKEYFSEWTDPDVAEFYIGCVLGIFEDDSDDTFRNYKGIFWIDNYLGNGLDHFIVTLVTRGFLIENEDNAVKWKLSEKNSKLLEG